MKKFFKRAVSGIVAIAILIVSPLSINVNAAFVKHQLPNYPCYVQNASNCWLYSIYSMVQYKGKNYACVEQLIGDHVKANKTSYNPNSGATIDEAYNLIVYVFSECSPIKHDGPLSQNEIIAQYSCNMPAYVAGERYDGSGQRYGHAVALVGYKKSTSDNNVYGIYYMNPQNGEVEFYAYAEGLVHKFSNNRSQVVYEWYNTITLI